MNNIEEELMKAISKQITVNVPKIYIQNMVSGRVFEYGKNSHDKLLISEDGRSLTYYNLQDGDGSCVGDYRFYYEKPKNEIDFDADEWARIVKHQSIKELLAEERKKVLWEIRKRAKRTQIYIKPTEKSPTGKEKCFVYEVSDDFLDQIERGTDEKLTKGYGMDCRCGKGKRCRYNKGQWKVEKRMWYKKIRKMLVKQAERGECV